MNNKKYEATFNGYMSRKLRYKRHKVQMEHMFIIILCIFGHLFFCPRSSMQKGRNHIRSLQHSHIGKHSILNKKKLVEKKNTV